MEDQEGQAQVEARPLRVLQFQEFTSSAGIEDLIQQVETFIDNAGDDGAPDPKPSSKEARIHSWRYQVDSGTHNLILIYTE